MGAKEHWIKVEVLELDGLGVTPQPLHFLAAWP